MSMLSVLCLQSGSRLPLDSPLPTKRRGFSLMGIAILCFFVFFCVSCTGSASPAKKQDATHVSSTTSAVALSHLQWCDHKRDQTFRDDASASLPYTPTPATQLGPANGTPAALTNWSIVKANLGFSVFLPLTLPAHTCLLSAASVIRHPVIGSNLVLTYMLANHETLTISQAPVLHVQNEPFQCSSTTGNTQKTTENSAATKPASGSTAQSDPVLICSGIRSTTNVVFSAHGTSASLLKLFMSLQPNVNWMPAA